MKNVYRKNDRLQKYIIVTDNNYSFRVEQQWLLDLIYNTRKLGNIDWKIVYCSFWITTLTGLTNNTRKSWNYKMKRRVYYSHCLFWISLNSSGSKKSHKFFLLLYNLKISVCANFKKFKMTERCVKIRASIKNTYISQDTNDISLLT